MTEPDLVARCVEAMMETTNIPITVICRIGVDDQDEQQDLDNFVNALKKVACKTIIIHARKAWLKGLSPKENRDIPPLNYDRVYTVKKQNPNLEIVINGGIKTTEETAYQLTQLDGVMIGREAYQNSYILAKIEKNIFKQKHVKTREDVAKAMIPYIEQQNKDFGTPVKSITRHMTSLFKGQPGSRAWRQILSTRPHMKGETGKTVVESALSNMVQAKTT